MMLVVQTVMIHVMDMVSFLINSGACVENGKAHTCTCNNDYTGAFCAEKKCNLNCLNGG